MRVGVERNPDRRVPEPSLHDLRRELEAAIGFAVDAERRVKVTERVEATVFCHSRNGLPASSRLNRARSSSVGFVTFAANIAGIKPRLMIIAKKLDVAATIGKHQPMTPIFFWATQLPLGQFKGDRFWKRHLAVPGF